MTPRSMFTCTITRIANSASQYLPLQMFYLTRRIYTTCSSLPHTHLPSTCVDISLTVGQHMPYKWSGENFQPPTAPAGPDFNLLVPPTPPYKLLQTPMILPISSPKICLIARLSIITTTVRLTITVHIT